MRDLLSRIWRRVDVLLDGIIWLHERAMLFVCVTLMPAVLALAGARLLTGDAGPGIGDRLQSWFLVVLLMLPAWLGFCIWAERTGSLVAARILRAMWTTALWIGVVLIAVGAVVLLRELIG